MRVYRFKVMPDGVGWRAQGENIDEAFNQSERPVLPGNALVAVGWGGGPQPGPESLGYQYCTNLTILEPGQRVLGHLVYPKLREKNDVSK